MSFIRVHASDCRFPSFKEEECNLCLEELKGMLAVHDVKLDDRNLPEYEKIHTISCAARLHLECFFKIGNNCSNCRKVITLDGAELKNHPEYRKFKGLAPLGLAVKGPLPLPPPKPPVVAPAVVEPRAVAPAIAAAAPEIPAPARTWVPDYLIWQSFLSPNIAEPRAAAPAIAAEPHAVAPVIAEPHAAAPVIAEPHAAAPVIAEPEIPLPPLHHVIPYYKLMYGIQ